MATVIYVLLEHGWGDVWQVGGATLSKERAEEWKNSVHYRTYEEHVDVN